MAEPSPDTEDAVLFRPNKKRKIYRQRAATNDEETAEQQVLPAPPTAPASAPLSLDELIASASSASAPLDAAQEMEGVAVPMSEILRLRRKNKRAGGVEFRASAKIRGGDEEEGGAREMVLAGEDGGADVPLGPPRKFAPQMGAVADTNKHMMAYIDSELAKRRSESQPQSHLQNQPLSQFASATPTPPSETTPYGLSTDTKKADPTLSRQPAAIGKLQEIDLGEEARAVNVQRTRKAQRLLNGEVVDEDEEKEKKPVKVRLGPDGKPWRGRKKRGEEDVKRDRAVEDVLRENRQIYEPPTPDLSTSSNPGNNTDADAQLAEAFTRDFMDAVSQRAIARKKTTQVQSSSGQGKKEDERLKGPKLGGSRSSRASMREAMLKAERGKK